MPRSLSNLLNNPAEGIHKIKCKYANNKKTVGIKYKDCERYLDYTNIKGDVIL